MRFYNPLILELEKKFSKIKKQNKKRFLSGLYQELFTRDKDTTHYRQLFDSLSLERKEQFIGFFMEELDSVSLRDISTSLKKRNPTIEKIEIRGEIDGKLHCLKTWKDVNPNKKLEDHLGQHQTTGDEYNELSYMFNLMKRNVNYVEIKIGEDIYGGEALDQMQQLSEHTLYVREDLSWLPKKYTANGESQTKIMQFYGRRHNIGPMVRMYLYDAGFRLEDYSGLERYHLRKRIKKMIRHDSNLLTQVDEYFKSNKSTTPKLPSSLLKLEQ